MDRLAEAANVDIKDFSTFLEAIGSRHDHFHAVGGRLSDHGVETFYDGYATESEMEAIFQKESPGRTSRSPG